MSLLYIYILWVAVGVDSKSAAANITVSARVGSTALLPCQLTNVSNQTHVRWRTNYEFIIEQSSGGTSIGSGYKGRVDVPVDELRKGICSLLLKNIILTDDSFYKFYVVEYADSVNPNKWNEINRVKLSVDVSQIISAEVGSTVILPCEWRNLSIETPHVQWNTDSEVVFERLGRESIQGEGYEGRVDVPEDELLKGNCSLVLKNVAGTDAGVYRSGMQVKYISETVLVQKVELSVFEKLEKSKEETSAGSGDAGINCDHLLSFIISLLVCFLISH